MSCNKLSTYEVVVVVKEKFASVENAVDNKDAIGEPVSKIVSKRFLKSNIKLEDKDGLRSKEDKGSSGKTGESSKGDAKS
jgi:hypothetical protein